MVDNQISFRLPKNFFRDNPLKDISAAMLTFFQITQQDNSSLDALFNEVGGHLNEARREKIAEERCLIEQTNNPAELVEIARKGCDISNRQELCRKILSCQEQAVPLMLKRYRTCALDFFIESATIVLASGDIQYAQALRQMYSEIRCPYAKACACLVFGVQDMQEEIPFLYREFEIFKIGNRDDGFEQHPLLALYLLCNKL